MRSMLLGAVVEALVIAACFSAPESPAAATSARLRVQASTVGQDRLETLSMFGVERYFWLHLPRKLHHGGKLPLVIVLHGGGGNGEEVARMTNFSDLADREGLIVVYPEGSGRLRHRFLTWNSGSCCGWALDHKVDDVSFLRHLISNLKQRLPVDDRRVYLTGFSNGGMMTYRAACELSSQIAAIAPVAGALDVKSCEPTSPVSVVIFHGTNDEHVLYGGGAPVKLVDRRHPRIDRSVAYAFRFWAARDGCGRTLTTSSGGSILEEVREGCTDGTAVVLYAIRGQGHAWPGGTRGAPWADPPSREIDATETIWSFFAQHPKQ